LTTDTRYTGDVVAVAVVPAATGGCMLGAGMAGGAGTLVDCIAGGGVGVAGRFTEGGT
jgi:hypothetical protein